MDERALTFNNTLDFFLESMLSMTLDHVDSFDVSFTRLGGHAVQRGLLPMLVEELPTLLNVSATLDLRRYVLCAGK